MPASQAGRRRFESGRPLSQTLIFLLAHPRLHQTFTSPSPTRPILDQLQLVPHVSGDTAVRWGLEILRVFPVWQSGHGGLGFSWHGCHDPESCSRQLGCKPCHGNVLCLIGFTGAAARSLRKTPGLTLNLDSFLAAPGAPDRPW